METTDYEWQFALLDAGTSRDEVTARRRVHDELDRRYDAAWESADFAKTRLGKWLEGWGDPADVQIMYGLAGERDVVPGRIRLGLLGTRLQVRERDRRAAGGASHDGEIRIRPVSFSNKKVARQSGSSWGATFAFVKTGADKCARGLSSSRLENHAAASSPPRFLRRVL